MDQSNFIYNEDIASPESTEHLLFNFLRPQMKRQRVKKAQNQLVTNTLKPQLWDNTYMLVDGQDCNVVIELNSFTDLQAAIDELEPTASSSPYSTEEDLVNFSDLSVPPAIRLNVESSQMLDVLMDRAVQHWCCIGFKVAPISVHLVQNWRKAPRAIIYCIASISMVTFMDQQAQNSLYFKQAAMAFYEQARNKLDDILLDDMQPLVVQSYFCLSYTSNLLRLYEQQRTWGSLASISLQHLASQGRPRDDLILGCWLRWYYVDAWMCLTLNRDCLLPDEIPWLDRDMVEHLSLSRLCADKHNLYSFATLTYYMRRYIKALNSGKMFANAQRHASYVYYDITRELTGWYAKLPRYDTTDDLHLHLCYHSMRLVVLYQFLHPTCPPTPDILIECLETNVQLLQALQHLKTLGCDQSTYHHMFFAIHNTAKRIFQYNTELRSFATEQLKINLMLLKSTQAYAHDVFKMKIYAQKIQDQFTRMNLRLEEPVKVAPALPPSQQNIIVFRRDDNVSIKKKRKEH